MNRWTARILVIGMAMGAAAASNARDYEWDSIHGNRANQRYVGFSQINRQTVTQLGASWVSEPFAEGATSRMTPLVHGGRMLFAAGRRIYALDARTGAELWTRETETRKADYAGLTNNPAALRAAGVAVSRAWGLGLGGGMVFAGMGNGHLLALREETGELVWDKLISKEPLARSRGIICTPLYVNGTLFLGVGQGEYGRGYVLALDAETGDEKWSVSTTPGPGEPGHETWPRDNMLWQSGGAHPWASAAADLSAGLVYFVTSNPGYPSSGGLRAGDNLYSVSILALEMKSGRLSWYRQLVHHDLWEADLSVPPVLFERKVQGKMRKGVAVLRGDGYLFQFDRLTGEPLSPVDERKVPQDSALATALTQPFPRDGESILPPCESWRDKIPRGFVLGCMFEPPSRDVPNRLSQYASARIAPMSYDPGTGYFYAQATNSLMWQEATGDDPYVWVTNVNGTRVPNFPVITAVVAAIDSRTDKVVWRKELPTFDDSGYKSNGGSLSVGGGLVFHQGGDGTLQAYDARTGETLWKFQTDFAVGDASPMSYIVSGRQYVAFIAGNKVWAFSLGGKVPQAAEIPAPPHEAVKGSVEATTEIETSSAEPSPARGRRYTRNEWKFNPYRARVSVGSTVVFVNNGLLPHTITASDGAWSTGAIAPAQTGSVRFSKPGNFLYHMTDAPWAYGEIIVVEPGSETIGAENEQVRLGKAAYAAACATCHGTNLSGRDAAPALAGRGFSSRWAGRDALALFERIRSTMPPTSPASLRDDSYAAIVAYIVSVNGTSLPALLNPSGMRGLPVAVN